MLETKRLLMRPLEESDLENIKRTLQDEAAMYAYEGAFSDEEAAEWLKRQMKRQDDYGLGLWAVILKETNTFIGQCGLTYQPWKGNKVLEVDTSSNELTGTTDMPRKRPGPGWTMLLRK